MLLLLAFMDCPPPAEELSPSVDRALGNGFLIHTGALSLLDLLLLENCHELVHLFTSPHFSIKVVALCSLRTVQPGFLRLATEGVTFFLVSPNVERAIIRDR